MHLNQVNLLLDIVQTHSFNQTAERFFTTQQNVSYSMKQLENELGVTIFNRSKNGVAFTPEGEIVLECAVNIYHAYQEMQQKLRGEGTASQYAKVVLYMSSALLAAKMPEVLRAYSQSCPNHKVLIKEVEQDAIVPALINGSCDIAIWSVNQGYGKDLIKIYSIDMFDYKVIAKDMPVAVVALDSDFSNRKSLSLQDLGQVPKSIYGLHPIDYFGKNVEPYILYADNNLDIHQQLLLEGNTICFTGQLIYEQMFDKERFTTLAFNYPVLPVYHIILKKKRALNDKNMILEEIIMEQFVRMQKKVKNLPG